MKRRSLRNSELRGCFQQSAFSLAYRAFLLAGNLSEFWRCRSLLAAKQWYHYLDAARQSRYAISITIA